MDVCHTKPLTNVFFIIWLHLLLFNSILWSGIIGKWCLASTVESPCLIQIAAVKQHLVWKRFSTVIHKGGAWELNRSCAVISSSEEWSFLPLQIHLFCHLPLPKMQGFGSPLAARRTGIFTSSQDEVARLQGSIFSVYALVKRCKQGQWADSCLQNSRPCAPSVVSASGREWAPNLGTAQSW